MRTREFESLDSLLDYVTDALPARISDRGRTWWDRVRSAVDSPSLVARSFPGLARNLGQDPLVEPGSEGRFARCPEILMDLAGYRAADLGAMLLVRARLRAKGVPHELRDLFDHGDLNERVGVMRCLPLCADDAVVQDLFGEAQRSNTVDVYEAAWCDHDFAVRRLRDDDFNRMVLKLAFTDLPLWRVLRGDERANTELSRMLEDFALEREAAGRPVWPDTLILQARAPIEATRARVQTALTADAPDLRAAATRAQRILDQE